MTYEPIDYAALRGVKYAISVFQALAQNNELPPAGVSTVLFDRPGNMMMDRPPIPVSNVASEINVDVVNRVCKGATAYHLLKKSTVPISLRHLSRLFNVSEDELWLGVEQLSFLQGMHVRLEYKRLKDEYRQRIIAEERAKEIAAKLAMTTEDRMAQIKRQLVGLAEIQGLKALPGIDLEALSDNACRLIAMFEYYQDPTMTVTRIAELAGISTSRVGHIMQKLMRQWRHPARYGGIFSLHINGGPRSHTNSLELVNPLNIDEDGDMVMETFEDLTFGECIAKIQTFLKQFDESILLPLPS